MESWDCGEARLELKTQEIQRYQHLRVAMSRMEGRCLGEMCSPIFWGSQGWPCLEQKLC
jgi:hypothetical protein